MNRGIIYLKKDDSNIEIGEQMVHQICEKYSLANPQIQAL